MDTFVLGSVLVVPARNLVRRDRKDVRVNPKEMAVLQELVAAGGRVVSRDELLGSVWEGVVVRQDAPTLAVSRLRKALGDDRRQPRFIETIPKGGYRLLLEAAEAVNTPPAASPRSWRGALGYAVLGMLLLVMTLLFFAARAGYEQAQAELPLETARVEAVE